MNHKVKNAACTCPGAGPILRGTAIRNPPRRLHRLPRNSHLCGAGGPAELFPGAHLMELAQHARDYVGGDCRSDLPAPCVSPGALPWPRFRASSGSGSFPAARFLNAPVGLGTDRYSECFRK
jgi:hypothetical protein